MSKFNLYFRAVLFALVAVALTAVATEAQAGVIVDGDAGLIISTQGNVTVISLTGGDTEGNTIGLDVDNDSVMDLTLQTTGEVFWGTDGDSFAVALDGETLNPDPETSAGSFGGTVTYYTDVPLSAGEHTLAVTQTSGEDCFDLAVYTLVVTEDSSGGGSPSAVPEPASFVLLGSGLIGLAGVGLRRRRNRKKLDVKK